MQLEDYFDFSPPPNEWIQFKGRRIAIQHVIELYNRHMVPEQIASYFVCPLEVEQVYAAIAYYLHNKEFLDSYMIRVQNDADAAYQEYLESLPAQEKQRRRDLEERIREAKTSRRASA